eukprot:EC120974.1.p1 GENE.EC120974.1~~EC120974.1.p1  ORF type:complete len:145 (+),score=8.43 EC120974.1:116-550(+)
MALSFLLTGMPIQHDILRRGWSSQDPDPLITCIYKIRPQGSRKDTRRVTNFRKEWKVAFSSKDSNACFSCGGAGIVICRLCRGKGLMADDGNMFATPNSSADKTRCMPCCGTGFSVCKSCGGLRALSCKLPDAEAGGLDSPWKF